MKLMPLALLIGSVLPLASDDKPVLPKLREAAGKKMAAWEALNKSLEVKLAPLHRCDPRIKAYIAAARKASEDRLGAWNLYVRAWLDSAEDASATGKSAGLEAAKAQAAIEIEEVSKELGDLETRRAELVRGPQKSDIALDEALKNLDRLIEINHEKAKLNEKYTAQAAELPAPSGRSSGAALTKNKLIEKVADLVRTETALWNANYDARLARANADCLIGPGTSSPKASRQSR